MWRKPGPSGGIRSMLQPGMGQSSFMPRPMGLRPPSPDTSDHHHDPRKARDRRDKGRQVAETLLQAHPEATAIYAHNDEMALGAISALEAAGKKPGKDVTIVSVDGERDGIQAVADGKMGATV